jgi:hypothetical protein
MKKIAILAVATAVSLSGIMAGPANAKSRKHHGPGYYNHQSMNPSHTRHDPPGTRSQCRGGCGGGN